MSITSMNMTSLTTSELTIVAFAKLVSYTGRVGSTAQILAQGLTGATSVTFNGVPATSFKVVSDT